jgi:hypothetical protein
VFVGQPELHAKLKSPQMRQVDQRVCGYHRLEPMDREAVAGYVQRRLLVAGLRQDRMLFPPHVTDALHLRSGGVPRLINRICDRALHIACERQTPAVDREILNSALIEIGAATLSPTWDSIVFSTPTPTPPIAVAPVAPIAPPRPEPRAAEPGAAAAPPARPAQPAPVIDEEEPFDKQIDRWVEKDLRVPSRPSRPLHEMFEADGFELPAAARGVSAAAAASRHEPLPRTVTRDWPRDVRSETYLRRLSRKWMKWIAIVAIVVAAGNVAVMGISLVGESMTPPLLPSPPKAPAPVLPAVATAVPADGTHVPSAP